MTAYEPCHYIILRLTSVGGLPHPGAWTPGGGAEGSGGGGSSGRGGGASVSESDS